MSSMKYIVKKGDTLWKIAQAELGQPALWQQIAKLNGLKPPSYLIVIGQQLLLPEERGSHLRPTISYGGRGASDARSTTGRIAAPLQEQGADLLPGRAYLFVLADEVLPSAKLVRKVLE